MTTPTPAQLRWQPGLDRAHRTLGSVYRSMPKDPDASIPWYVRLLENPASPLALPGAIDLFGHDCIHIVLGRGLTPRDEAFVLGFTMGSTRCSTRQAAWFGWFARYVYRQPYRFGTIDRRVFDFAFAAAQTADCVALDGVDYHAWLEHPIARLRSALSLDPKRLAAIYAGEQVLFASPLEACAGAMLPPKRPGRASHERIAGAGIFQGASLPPSPPPGESPGRNPKP